jgi:hypothetical protein
MQIFPRSLNKLPLVAAVLGNVAVVGVVFVFWYWLSPRNLVMGYAPTQPVPYSHRLHVGQLGMDCRYCHANIERAAKAMIPPTQVCMGCHSVVKTDSAKLAPIRASWETGKAVEWVQVHRLPDHVFFDHSAHLHAGVGCVSCHGRVDEEEIVKVQQPLSMGWCLECHRDPTPNLRPKSEITNMTWVNDGKFEPPAFKPEGCGTTPSEKAPCVSPPQNCSGCHR